MPEHRQGVTTIAAVPVALSMAMLWSLFALDNSTRLASRLLTSHPMNFCPAAAALMIRL